MTESDSIKDDGNCLERRAERINPVWINWVKRERSYVHSHF